MIPDATWIYAVRGAHEADRSLARLRASPRPPAYACLPRLRRARRRCRQQRPCLLPFLPPARRRRPVDGDFRVRDPAVARRRH
jgi:hypothetical protein